MIEPHQIPDWETQRLDKVNQYWRPTIMQGYRQWLSTDHIIRQGMESNQQILGWNSPTRKSDIQRRRMFSDRATRQEELLPRMRLIT